MYTPTSILPVKGKPLYSDSPAPHNVSSVSPLDPQLFISIDGYAQALVRKEFTPRYHPIEVAQWIDEMVSQSTAALSKAKKSLAGRMASPVFRRAEEDILILNGLGRYFASLFRAALCYSLFESTGDKKIAEKSLEFYRSALTSWREMATLAKSVYASDVSYGSTPVRRGHWMDRIPEIEKDVAALEAYFFTANVTNTGVDAVALIASPPRKRPNFTASHTPAQTFRPGSDLTLRLQAADPITEVVLWYRHVTHAERWHSEQMARNGQVFTASIPTAYTQSLFPLQYYFELRGETDATFHPVLNGTLSNQPYFAVYKRM
jgi:hypothetical protein